MATNATAKRRKRQVVRAVAEVYADTRLVAPRLLHPNPWNINRMSERAFAGLKESIRLSGFCDPIEARAHGRAGHFQILGGEHRWRAARQLHMPRVSVNVLRVPSDVAARKLVLQLNAHGEVDLVDLAEELTHLQRELGADLGTGLPYTQRGLEELLALVGRARAAEQGTPQAGDGAFMMVAFSVPVDAFGVIDQAIRKAMEAGASESRGLALERVCADYLAGA